MDPDACYVVPVCFCRMSTKNRLQTGSRTQTDSRTMSVVLVAMYNPEADKHCGLQKELILSTHCRAARICIPVWTIAKDSCLTQ